MNDQRICFTAHRPCSAIVDADVLTGGSGLEKGDMRGWTAVGSPGLRELFGAGCGELRAVERLRRAVLARADAVGALERDAEWEGAAVADLGGDLGDFAGTVEKQVSGEDETNGGEVGDRGLDAELGPALEAIWVKNYSVYGRRKLATAARKAGLDAGRDQLARLMRERGIRAASRAKNRFTTHADPAAVRAPDLVKRNFTATGPDQLWVADFTYCSTWSGVIYVAFVIDVFSRRIVGCTAARTMHAGLVVDALNMAAWTRRGTDLAGLICHNDTGSQYTSVAHTDRLAELGAAASIGTVGDSYDAMAESVNALYKTELHRNPAVLAANGGHWKGLDDLEAATCGWVSWFNEDRVHRELNDCTPAEVEAAHYRHLGQANAA